MSTRARLQNANDSNSLWNYTLSPGWSDFDAHILRLAIMRYGCGSWVNISRHFPNKNCNQLNLQTQRLFGQQALAEFQKVHVDPNRIKIVNDKIEGFRKNQCLINTGNNVSAEEKENRRKEHTQKYGIPLELYQKIQVPVVLDPPSPCETVIDDIEKLREMYRCVYDIQLRLKHLEEIKNKMVKNGASKTKKSKKKGDKNNGKKKSDDGDVEMGDNDNNKNKKNEDKGDKDDDGDVEVVDAPKPKPKQVEVPMDDDVAMAMALSMSMANANIDTPKPGKTKAVKSGKKKSTKKKKASTKKKRGSKKRKKMQSDDEDEYVPEPAKKRVKRK